MGLCLDTDESKQNNDVTSASKAIPTSDVTNGTTFSDVPMIFVLGGPGSGKISHCEVYAKSNGCVHINMTNLMDLRLQAINGTNTDILSKEEVLNILKVSLGSRSTNTCYLVSGYPRNMNDLSFYLENIGRVDGVIFINWHEKSLEQQVKYGASIGEIDKDLAKAELNNFKAHVIAITEYFDFKSLLHEISGDRKPEYVYEDFEECVTTIREFPDEGNRLKKPRPVTAGSYRYFRDRIKAEENGQALLRINGNHRSSENLWIIYVIGGPGSKKYNIVLSAVNSDLQNWHIISSSTLIFNYLEECERPKFNRLSSIIQKGESFPNNILMDIILNEVNANPGYEGYIIVGYPRDIGQMEDFERAINCSPLAVLIDCSELTLSKHLSQRSGRSDDNLYAYKRRLDIYRKSTLPLLKRLDEESRLKIIDGDTSEQKIMLNARQILKTTVQKISDERHEWTKNIVKSEI